MTSQCERYADLLKMAVDRAAFGFDVFTEFIHQNVFPNRLPLLCEFRNIEQVVRSQLTPALRDRGSETSALEAQSRAEEYVFRISRLGWDETALATASFGRAAVLRLLELYATAPQHDRQLFAAHIDLEKYLITAAERSVSRGGEADLRGGLPRGGTSTVVQGPEDDRCPAGCCEVTSHVRRVHLSRHRVS